MNKLSKLTALLLALVLVLSVPLQVMAESADTTVKDAIGTLTEYLKVADTALYEKIMSFEKYSEYWGVGYLLEDEDIIAYIANNDADRVKEIQDHLDDLFWASSTSYPGKPGPLVSGVADEAEAASTYSLRSMTRESTTSTTFEDHVGLELDKKATLNKDGKSYTITLEAYATGTVKTTTQGTPLDIVLVLDVSNSMNNSFGSTTRMAALKTGVKSFISAIHETYTADTMNHRISITTFAGSTQQTQTWTDVDDAGVTTLNNFVTSMSQTQGTNQGAGMTAAQTLLTTNYGSPSPTPRQKVVVLFTDGGPSSGNGCSTTAINTAKSLKDSDVIIYTIAVSDGADPTQTPTTSINNKTGKDDTASDTINALMHAISSNYLGATATGTGNTTTVTFNTLNSAVSPFAEPYSSYYLTGDNPDDLNQKFKNIATEINTGSTPIELGTETVLKDVVTPYFTVPANASAVNVYTVDCTGFTTVDGVSVPTWGNRVLLPQAESADDAAVTAGTKCYVSISGQTIDIKGFDYSKNYVAPAADNHVDPLGKIATGSFMGRKLVVEFVVTPESGFLGGDRVDTNEATSGIYEIVDGAEKPFEGFDQPKVDIAVPPLKIVGEDQHIYLGNNASLDELLQSFSVYYDIMGDTDNDGVDDDYVSGRHKVDSILNHYVQLDFTLYLDNDKDGVVDTDANGDTLYASYSIAKEQQSGKWTYNQVVSDSLSLAFTDDVTPFVISYKATATEPTYVNGVMTDPGNYSEGSMTANIYVYKPQVTFQDTRHEYRTAATADGYYDANNYVNGSLKWYNAELKQYSTDAKVIDAETNQEVSAMLGTEPKLTFTYDPLSTTWITDGLVTGTACVPVNVTNVLIDGDNEININATENANSGYLTSYRTPYTPCTDCNDVHGTTTPTNVASGTSAPYEFVVHIYNVHGALAISKTVENASAGLYTVDANQEFTFTVTLKDGDTPVTGAFECILPDGNKSTVTFDENGVATVALKHGQTITIEGITNNIAYTVTETPVVGFTPDKTEASGNIVANDTKTAAFTNTYNVGQLTVTKTVDDQSGMYDLSGDQFSFTVTFNDTTNPIGYTINGTQGTTTNGTATFILVNGQTATFDRIPAGVTYTVTEDTSNLIAGYTQGTASNVSGTIAANTISAATVQNIYNTGSLTIKKTGMDAGEYAVFKATVVARGVKQTFQVVVPNGGSAVIKGLDLGSAYTVTEVGDWTWRYTSEVTSGSGNGTIPTESDYKAEVTFKNTKNNEQWIDGNTYAENAFGDAGDSNATVERK